VDPTDTHAPPRADTARQVTVLYQAHSLGLVRLAVIMLGDKGMAEDVVQEAFLGLFRRWPSLSDPDKALAYVRSSVLNGCRTILRQQRRTSRSARNGATAPRTRPSSAPPSPAHGWPPSTRRPAVPSPG